MSTVAETGTATPNGEVIHIGPIVTNGAEDTIVFSQPYVATATLTGVADLLFHRWNCEGVAAKARAAKGSAAKKTDDIDTYVWRDETGMLCLPGEYVLQSMIHAAKFRQDPRSPRKSAMDLFKAGVACLTELAPLGTDKWDYEDRRRVTVQRQGITRVRPAFRKGWSAAVQFIILLPEYVSNDVLLDVLTNAGRLIGVGDFRPSHGRYAITKFEVDLP